MAHLSRTIWLSGDFVTPPSSPWLDAVRPHDTVPTKPTDLASGSVWAVPISLAATPGIDSLSSPQGTEMFQFPWLTFDHYGFMVECSGITRNGLPHSDIPGLKVVCTYPRLIAAYHVLHRLQEPRHPPDTLSSLILSSFPSTDIVFKDPQAY